jgi:archaellum component FlaC
MTHENRSTSASTDSHSMPETANINHRVQKLRDNVRELSETIEGVQKKLREAAGETEKNDE